MSDGTHIEWTDATANVVNGCTVVSPGCEHCYAMRLAATRLRNHPSREGLARIHNDHPQWTGKVSFHAPALLQVLRWNRPRRIFWNAHGDLFHDNVSDDWIDRCFAVMALTPHHTHQVLTKRPERMRAYLSNWPENAVDAKIYALDPKEWERQQQRPFEPRWPLPNVWLGVSVEDQKRAEERIPILLDTPAAIRWLSCEPLLGPVDLDKIYLIDTPPGHTDDEVWGMRPLKGRYGIRLMTGPDRRDDFLDGGGNPYPKIDWVVVGGESGPGARPMHPDWARSLRDQCATAGVPFLFKQWGEWSPDGDEALYIDEESDLIAAWPDGKIGTGDATTNGGKGVVLYKIGKKAAGRLLDGVQHDGYPA